MAISVLEESNDAQWVGQWIDSVKDLLAGLSWCEGDVNTDFQSLYGYTVAVGELAPKAARARANLAAAKSALASAQNGIGVEVSPASQPDWTAKQRAVDDAQDDLGSAQN